MNSKSKTLTTEGTEDTEDFLGKSKSKTKHEKRRKAKEKDHHGGTETRRKAKLMNSKSKTLTTVGTEDTEDFLGKAKSNRDALG